MRVCWVSYMCHTCYPRTTEENVGFLGMGSIELELALCVLGIELRPSGRALGAQNLSTFLSFPKIQRNFKSLFLCHHLFSANTYLYGIIYYIGT